MSGTLPRGLFLAVLAMAAGELKDLGGILMDCNSGMQGCDPDEQELSTLRDELQGLELLQMEFKLHSGLAKTVPVAAHAHVQSVAAKPWAFAKMANNKTEVPTLDLQLKSSLSLVGSITSQSPHGVANLLAILVSRKSASEVYGIGVGCIVVTLCAYFIYSAWQGSQEKSSPSSSQQHRQVSRPSAHQGLQAPRSSYVAHPHVAQPPVASPYNPQLALPPTKMPGDQLVAQPPVASPYNPQVALPPTKMPGVVGQTASLRPFLPPICPSLILPHAEARFMIPLESLMDAAAQETNDGQLDILGNAGRKLLHGTVGKTPEGRRTLALACCGSGDEPRVTLLAPPRDGAHRGGVGGDIEIMELYGGDGVFYGTLEPAAGGGATLRCDGELVMSLEIGHDLHITASSMDGQLLASAGKNLVQASIRPIESKDMWKLQVKPNLDAVLMITCMLAVMIFK